MNASRLKHFPVSFFSMIMGMAGLTIAWQKAGQVLNLPAVFGQLLAPLTVATFVTLLLFYSLKMVRYRQAVNAELHNPVKLNFFPAISISLLLISIALLPLSEPLAHGLWLTGVILHFVITLYVMRVWIHHEHFEIHHINPAWFIPVVGNVLIPIAGSPLGYHEISWFFFSIGMVFWIVLFTIIFNRCQPWRAKRRLVDPSSREAALFSRRALRQRENKVGLRTRRPVIWEPSTERQRAYEVVA